MRIRSIALAPLAATSLAAQQDSLTRRDTALLAPTVVTVTRTAQPLARAPFAVGVATRDEIQRGKPGLALDEALALIPGVQVDNRFNYALGERISVRGIGARAQFGVRGVRVILDGVPMTLADGQTTLNNVDVGSLDRAEVIRGPASALHGNAAGGVIQLESGRPDPGTAGRGGELRITGGAHGLMRTEVAATGRAGATGYTARASRLAFDGFRQWSEARNDRVVARALRERDGRAAGFTVNFVDYDGQNPGGLSRALLAVSRDTAFTNNLRDRTGERGRQAQLGATFSRPAGAARLDLSAHALWRAIENPIPQRIVVIDRGAGGARGAVSLAPTIAGRAANLAVGAELQLQRDDRRNFVSDSGRRGADTLSQLERVVNGAAFAQGSLELTDRLLATAGLRYDRIAFAATDRLVRPGNVDDSGRRTMRAVSPSVGITLSAAPRLDLYANVSTSFETPTTSELANREDGAGGLNPALEPQRARSVELGANARLRAGGIAGTWQLAVYHAAIRDALVPFEVASVPGRQYFRNAGSTRHRGVEVGTALVLAPSLLLRAAYTHIDARFDEYAVTSGTTTRVFDGNPVPGVAANRLDATLSIARPLATVDVDARASSSIPVDDANTERSEAFTLWGLRVTGRALSLGRVAISPHVGVLNLFDVDYNTSVVVNAFGGRYFEPGPGRSLHAGATLAF